MGPRSFNRGNTSKAGSFRVHLNAFNGAAVIQPRKRKEFIRRAMHVEPSMGPRSFNRGNQPAFPLDARRLSRPSMGPRSFNRGNAITIAAQRDSGLPSMGPRSFNRGNHYAGQDLIWEDLPSMGPRSFNRGNRRVLSIFSASAYCLQWGRGHSTAETPRKIPDLTASACLQWGRGHSTAETRRAKHARHGDRSFNGAAVIQPRKRNAKRSSCIST